MSDPDQNRAMVAQAISRHGRLDLVVLNADLNPGQEPGGPLSVESYRGAVRVNVDGVALALSRQGGAIVVMASLAEADVSSTHDPGWTDTAPVMAST